MDKVLINQIKNNPLVYSFLREDSSYYKELNRGTITIKELEEKAKKHFKQTPEDKLKKISQNIELITTFLDVIN